MHWLLLSSQVPAPTRLCRALVVLGAMLAAQIAPADPTTVGTGRPSTPALTVTYPHPHSADDKRGDYYLKLLELALAKSGVQYDLHPSNGEVPSTLVIDTFKTGGIDIFWGPTTVAMEAQLQPIRIPIDKGIFGWRLLLINGRDRAKFAKITTLAQLRAIPAGQGRARTDNAILRANGLQTVEGGHYDTLFGMLAADRFQYLPRSVGVIWKEQQTYADLGIEVESHLALHYTCPSYFFVARNNKPLEQAVEQGLRAAFKDGGSFDKLFWQYNGPAVEHANLSNRVVFELNNPLLPETRPLVEDRGL